jgi:hypothetical protein
MVGNFVARLRRDVRNICKERLQVFRPSIPGPAFEEVRCGLDRADLLRDCGCNPLVQRYPVFFGQTRGRRFDRGRQLQWIGRLARCLISSSNLDGPSQPQTKSCRRLYEMANIISLYLIVQRVRSVMGSVWIKV